MNRRHKHKKRKHEERSKQDQPKPILKGPIDSPILPTADGTHKERVMDRDKSLTVAGLFIALVVAVIYFFQLRAMQHAINISVQSMQVDERAWVAHSNVVLRLDEDKAHHSRIVAKVTVKNTGKSFALGMQGHATFDTAQTPQTIDDFMQSHPAPSTVGSRSLIPPGGTLDIPLRMPADTIVASETAEDIRQGRKWIYMFGTVTYEDIFKKAHTTHFCVYYIPDGEGPADCPNGNYAD